MAAMTSDCVILIFTEAFRQVMEETDIDKLIRETVESIRPFPTYEITEETRKAVEEKLYSLPELCEKLEEAEGLDVLLISFEIRSVKRALELIQNDPYYPLIPAKYFEGAKERTSALLCSCDKATVWRNRKRLLDTMAVYLFGTGAWWGETRNW